MGLFFYIELIDLKFYFSNLVFSDCINSHYITAYRDVTFYLVFLQDEKTTPRIAIIMISFNSHFFVVMLLFLLKICFNCAIKRNLPVTIEKSATIYAGRFLCTICNTLPTMALSNRFIGSWTVSVQISADFCQHPIVCCSVFVKNIAWFQESCKGDLLEWKFSR